MQNFHTFLIAAISLDGFIAQQLNQPSTAWTCQEDKKFFHKKTKQAGTIVLGKTTFETIGFPLPNRLNIVYTSSSAETLAKKYNFSTSQASADNFRTTALQPAALVEQLAKEGKKQLAVCGGSSIYTQFMQAGLVNKLFLTVEPVVFGQGIKLFNQPINQKLLLVSSKKLNQQGSLLLEYDCQ